MALIAPPFGSLCLFTPLWGPPLLFYTAQPPRAPRGPTFSLTDIAIGMGMLSLANGLVGMVRTDMEPRELVFMFAAANVLAAGTWILGLRRLAKHGIEQQSHRLLFQIVLHPLAICAPSGVILNGCLIAPILLNQFDPNDIRTLPALGGVIVTGIWAGVCLFTRAWFFRLLAGRTVGESASATASAGP